MASVRLDGVVKHYASVVALDTLDLEVRDGEFITLLGPSGCGKTTTLRMIAGFVEPTAGRICLGDDDVTSHRADVARFLHVFEQQAEASRRRQRGMRKAATTSACAKPHA